MISTVPMLFTHLLVNWLYVPEVTRNEALRYFITAGTNPEYLAGNPLLPNVTSQSPTRINDD